MQPVELQLSRQARNALDWLIHVEVGIVYET
jgi:hypothetical protein